MLDRFEFLVTEALTALRRNGLMTFAAITTIAVSLFLLGGLGYSYYRLQAFTENLPGQFWMRVYLKDDATQSTVKQVIGKIRAVPGVASAVWIPRDKAWEKTKQDTPAIADVENPYPESFKVTLSRLEDSDAVVAQIKAIPEVAEDGVEYLKDEQNFVRGLLEIIRWLGPVLGGLLFLAGGILIYNAIRLTVLSRRLEIRIMQLVGASKWTVQIPFLFEGIALGIVGGIASSFLLSAAYRLIEQKINETRIFPLAPEAFPFGWTLVLLGFAGALYGLFCSTLAVNAPLKYR